MTINNILSLFDGMSCGQIAINKLGIKYKKYFASEIDKHAIKVCLANYPDTKQLGSVTDVKSEDLPQIDLLIGGSPCQSFSFAGKQKGMSTKCNEEILTLERYKELKQGGFEFEGQSYLFWEYVRILKETKPKYFLLENVMMSEKWEKLISKTLGVNPIMINSSLVSAQNRKRLYWTNIGLETDKTDLFGGVKSIIKQPEDKGILLKDVLEKEVDSKYFLSKKGVERIKSYNNSSKSLNNGDKKSMCLVAGYNKQGRDNKYVTHSLQPRNGKGIGGKGHLCKTDQKSYCVDTGNGQAIEYSSKIRRLTPIECERLQTVPNNYTNHVSDSQRYKMLGNGWTIDVIAHVLNYIK